MGTVLEIWSFGTFYWLVPLLFIWLASTKPCLTKDGALWDLEGAWFGTAFGFAAKRLCPRNDNWLRTCAPWFCVTIGPPTMQRRGTWLCLLFRWTCQCLLRLCFGNDCCCQQVCRCGAWHLGALATPTPFFVLCIWVESEHCPSSPCPTPSPPAALPLNKPHTPTCLLPCQHFVAHSPKATGYPHSPTAQWHWNGCQAVPAGGCREQDGQSPEAPAGAGGGGAGGQAHHHSWAGWQGSLSLLGVKASITAGKAGRRAHVCAGG